MCFPCHFWPRGRGPLTNQRARTGWLTNERPVWWERHDCEGGWVTAAVRRRGELIKVFTLSPHLTLPPSDWSLSLSSGLWLVITSTSHPRAVGRAGTAWSQWSGVTVTITLIGKLVAAQTQSWLFCRWLWQCEKLRNIQHEAYFCTGIVFGKVSNRCHIVWNVIKTKVVKIVYHISYIAAFLDRFEQTKFESFHLQAGNSWEIFIYPSLEDDSPGWSRSEVCLVVRGQYCATQMINRSYMHRKSGFRSRK